MDAALSEQIAEADAEGLNWAVFVEHEDGRTELVDSSGTASPVHDVAATRAILEEDGTLFGPVQCNEATAAGLDVLDNCDRCAQTLLA